MVSGEFGEEAKTTSVSNKNISATIYRFKRVYIFFTGNWFSDIKF